MNEILQLLKAGGVLRHSYMKGFHIIKEGKAQIVNEASAQKLVQQKIVLPNGKDQHGVFIFTPDQRRLAAMEGGPA